MGLDVSHDCWSGPYSKFMRFRRELATVAGVPLDLMDGFYEPPLALTLDGQLMAGWIRRCSEALPIDWALLKPDPIHVLLNHSDCDGVIEVADCEPLAVRLFELVPAIEARDEGRVAQFGAFADQWAPRVTRFAEGLMEASRAGEVVEFH